MAMINGKQLKTRAWQCFNEGKLSTLKKNWTPLKQYMKEYNRKQFSEKDI